MKDGDSFALEFGQLQRYGKRNLKSMSSPTKAKKTPAARKSSRTTGTQLSPVGSVRQKSVAKSENVESEEALLRKRRYADELYAQQSYAEAAQEYRVALEISQRVLGLEHPTTLASHNRLAAALYAQHNYAEAGQAYRIALEISQRVLGPEHPDTLQCFRSLAAALYAQCNYAEAEQAYRMALEISQRALGPEHPDTLQCRRQLAAALYAQRKYAEAEQEYRAILEISQRVLGPEHPHTLQSFRNLTATLKAQGKEETGVEFIHRASEQFLGTTEKARAFFLKYGFIDKDGNLAERYR